MISWKEYKLSDFLVRRYDSVPINDYSKYKRITVRSKGGGIEIRDEIAGVDIGTKNQFKVKANQFLLSKIDALNGAFGIVPPSCDGGIITGNFWTYDIDELIIIRDYLHLLCLKQVFTQLSIEASEGTTNRKYLREDRLLSKKLNLPSILGQTNIVRDFNLIIAKLKEIENLADSQIKDLDRLLYCAYKDLVKDSSSMPMRKVAPIVRRSIELNDEKQYPELGVRSFGKGTFHKPALRGFEVATKKIFQIKSGDLIFSNVFAWEGAIAIAKDEDNNRYGSHRFISCEVVKDIATASYLCYHFLTSDGLHDINSASPGGAGRNKTLGLEKLMKIEIPIPGLKQQLEFDHLLQKVNLMKKHFADRAVNFNNFLPSLLNQALRRGENTDVLEKNVATPVTFLDETQNITADLELAIIVELIESTFGISYGEVGIQKTIFNAEIFNPALNTKYDFVNYHFGTYSSYLSETIKRNPYLKKKNVAGGEVFVVTGSHKKEVLDFIVNHKDCKLVSSINRILEIYSMPFINKETDKIELLNTVTKLIIDLKTSDASIIYEGMKNWQVKQGSYSSKAQKFSFTDTVKTIKLIENLDLLSSLLIE